MVDTVQPRVLASFRNRSALSLLMNMQLLRWSKAKPETTGQDTRLERHSSDKGLDAGNHNRASGGGRRMFLTSPLIEPAIALKPLHLRTDLPTLASPRRSAVVQTCGTGGRRYEKTESQAELSS